MSEQISSPLSEPTLAELMGKSSDEIPDHEWPRIVAAFRDDRLNWKLAEKEQPKKRVPKAAPSLSDLGL